MVNINKKSEFWGFFSELEVPAITLESSATKFIGASTLRTMRLEMAKLIFFQSCGVIRAIARPLQSS